MKITRNEKTQPGPDYVSNLMLLHAVVGLLLFGALPIYAMVTSAVTQTHDGGVVQGWHRMAYQPASWMVVTSSGRYTLLGNDVPALRERIEIRDLRNGSRLLCPAGAPPSGGDISNEETGCQRLHA